MASLKRLAIFFATVVVFVVVVAKCCCGAAPTPASPLPYEEELAGILGVVRWLKFKMRVDFLRP
jgi:hypothetical protein